LLVFQILDTACRIFVIAVKFELLGKKRRKKKSSADRVVQNAALQVEDS